MGRAHVQHPLLAPDALGPGHFAPAGEPRLIARDIVAFLATFGR